MMKQVKQSDLNNYQKTLHQKEEMLKQKESECRKLQDQIKRMRQSTVIKITDHAMVRFLERAGLINFEWVKEQLITDVVKGYFKTLGDGEYPTGIANVRVVIKDATIVTVLV